MQEEKNRSGSQGASHGEAYSVDILQEIYHSDPNHRVTAAINGWGLDVLKNDEVWLVRHTAKRILHQQALTKAGIHYSPSTGVCTNIHIDDMVYELYKADWLNKHTTPDTRMQSVRDWCNSVLSSQENDCYPYFCDYWLEERGFLVRDGKTRDSYEDFYDFLGCWKPDCKGLYQDREYVAELLGHDEKLLALYDADINDDKELPCQFKGLGERLVDATERSKQMERGGVSKDEPVLM